MAKKKQGRPRTGVTPTVALFARVRPSVAAALREHVAGVQPKTTVGAVVSLAIEQYLARAGE